MSTFATITDSYGNTLTCDQNQYHLCRNSQYVNVHVNDAFIVVSVPKAADLCCQYQNCELFITTKSCDQILTIYNNGDSSTVDIVSDNILQNVYLSHQQIEQLFNYFRKFVIKNI